MFVLAGGLYWKAVIPSGSSSVAKYGLFAGCRRGASPTDHRSYISLISFNSIQAEVSAKRLVADLIWRTNSPLPRLAPQKMKQSFVEFPKGNKSFRCRT